MPLAHVAAAKGLKETLKAMLDSGAPVDLRDFYDVICMLPLMVAHRCSDANVPSAEHSVDRSGPGQ